MGYEDSECSICHCYVGENGECSNPHCSTHRTTVRAPAEGPQPERGFSSRPSRRISYRELIRRPKKSLAGFAELLASATKPAPLPQDLMAPDTGSAHQTKDDGDNDRPTPVDVPVAQNGEHRVASNEAPAPRAQSGTRRKAHVGDAVATLEKDKAGNG